MLEIDLNIDYAGKNYNVNFACNPEYEKPESGNLMKGDTLINYDIDGSHIEIYNEEFDCMRIIFDNVLKDQILYACEKKYTGKILEEINTYFEDEYDN